MFCSIQAVFIGIHTSQNLMSKPNTCLVKEVLIVLLFFLFDKQYSYYLALSVKCTCITHHVINGFYDKHVWKVILIIRSSKMGYNLQRCFVVCMQILIVFVWG